MCMEGMIKLPKTFSKNRPDTYPALIFSISLSFKVDYGQVGIVSKSTLSQNYISRGCCHE